MSNIKMRSPLPDDIRYPGCSASGTGDVGGGVALVHHPRRNHTRIAYISWREERHVIIRFIELESKQIPVSGSE
jgi:hypothetical protein